ncbi:MAG: hypothetical protein QM784_21475 [Polyangiaceae bacterium]
MLPLAVACSFLAPSDKELFGDGESGHAGNAGNAGNAAAGDGGEAGNAGTVGAGGRTLSSTVVGGTTAAGGTSTKTSAQGGASVVAGGTTASGGTTARVTTAAGGSTPAAGGTPAATGGSSPNGNCKYGSTGNNNDACASSLQDVWRCVVSSAQDGAWVSQVCHSGKWVTFHLSPRDCAGCCGAESSACCQANHSCSLVN